MNRLFIPTALTVAAIGVAVVGCSPSASSSKAKDSTKADEISVNKGTSAASGLAAVAGGPAKGKRDAKLETVATFDGPAMPVGIALSKSGRTFLSFPRWLDPVKNTVVELKDGKLTAFPDEETNAFVANDPQYKPAGHFVSAQAIVFDDQDRLWVLDPGSFNFAPNLPGGPKLWAYDINTRKRVKAIAFPNDVAMKNTALNDVRFDLKRGPEGTAYITDSGVGGIIVVDLASGQSWRHLDKHPSVMPVIGLKQSVEGSPFLQYKPNGEVAGPDFRSDGIALSPDGKTLYYMPVISRDVYSVPTDLLADKKADPMAVAKAVKKIASKPSGNDGIAADAKGMIYTTDFEDASIRRVNPTTGAIELVTQDERLIWPDTLALRDGYLYITSNQLARQPSYNAGKDKRQPPYALFRVKVGD